MTRKIIYSPDYGAGWWTWYHGPISFDDFCCHSVLVKAVKEGIIQEKARECYYDKHKLEDIFLPYNIWKEQMKVKYEIKEEDWCVYTYGLRDAVIEEVDDDVRVKIEEYDGKESIRYSYEEYY